MIRFDLRFDEEDRELGRRYLKDNEGLDFGSFAEKYASPELKEYSKSIKQAYAKVRAEGCF
mgnify:CR=1 FL=1